MKPLFDFSSKLVGWVSDDGKHVFNTDLRWVAYVIEKHSWSARSDRWIGPVVNGNFHDRDGHPFAWRNKIVASAKPPKEPARPPKPVEPATPMRPINPTRPMKAARPLGGWSQYSFDWMFG